MGIDFINKGRWTVRLTEVPLPSGPDGYAVEALANSGSVIASSAAIFSIRRDPEIRVNPSIGPVPGWAIEPTRLGEPRPYHGLRVTWAAGTAPPRQIAIRYRYVGIPFEYIIDESWLR